MDASRAEPTSLTSPYAIFCAFAHILAVSLAVVLMATSHAAAQASDLPGLAARVIDAVVNINVTAHPNTGTNSDDQSPGSGAASGEGEQPPPRRSLGSGFVIDASGIIVTNEHVIRNGDEIDVVFNDGSRLPAELIGEDADIDVAVLRVQPSTPLPAVKFADSDSIRVGEPVMAIGNPSGLGGTVTAGIVSAKNRDIRTSPFDNFIQTDTAINRGNSGGPLFNMAGDVIGTLGLASRGGGSIGLNFAVPAYTAMPIIARLREFGEPRRGWLGANAQDMTNEIAAALRLDAPRGALISGVYPRGPASVAGIRPGDVIVSFNEREVRDRRELSRLIAEAPVGTPVPVTMMRDGRSGMLTITLSHRQPPTTSGQPAPAVTAIGMELSRITPAVRSQLGLRPDASGVVVTDVKPESPAARQGIRPGTVFTEVHSTPVNSPAEFVARLEALKSEGRRSAVFLVLDANGQTRLIALDLM
ncbi:trypsin-like peptidase domain-containing protein [Rhizobium calliandrae]|uniref:Probable periplasmic serine endoprotease DegP-like n=1 Tax=Rhizobium calliandrae TaxID=1312182 RepID=A0ABT7KLI0_9HYPH|nr:trypsin-like peptidase domain-containing protein [Rhizobium calliandrae]MDL2408128.1 trypsin-like peptidase domain-containing protein [Rhizobium calliandrae]